MQIKLFAAMDSDGLIRFIGEVERGAACGCVCPVCESPLVAKQGSINEWHFAHEASQERPECEVGAANMIRRIAAEWMVIKGVPALPDYKRVVTARSASREAHREVRWSAQINQDGRLWDTTGSPSKAFLTGRLSTGVQFDASVLVGDHPPKLMPPTDKVVAHLFFWVPTPTQSDLTKRVHLEQHILRTGKWIWQSHPDHLGLLEKARQEAQAEAKSFDQALLDKYRQLKEAFERNRVRVEEERGVGREGFRQRLENTQQQAQDPDNSVPWAPDRRSNTSFVLYVLREGQGSWVIYQRFDGSFWLVPVPKFEGWDESIPASVWTAIDVEVGFKIETSAAATVFLGARARLVRSSSDPKEIEKLAMAGWALRG